MELVSREHLVLGDLPGLCPVGEQGLQVAVELVPSLDPQRQRQLLLLLQLLLRLLRPLQNLAGGGGIGLGICGP